MPTVDINGYSFKYVERGSGPPLVFVHGSASDYRTWQAQQEAFARHFRTIAYSRRYHWPNEPMANGADYAMAEHVDDLEALIRSQATPPVHLVGHSYGAFVCLLLAVRAPELVEKLVLAEPPAITLFVSDPPRPGEMLKLLLSRPRTAAEIAKFGAGGVGPATEAVKRGDMEEALDIFGKATLGHDAYRRLSEERRDQARANLIKAEFLGSGYPPLDTGEIDSVGAKTLLVSGEQSPGLFHRLLDRIEELLPYSARVEIPGASHIMHEDNAPAYRQAVLGFLKGT
jgi:pimeloyl-ACP methyl ester carboxylesterase